MKKILTTVALLATIATPAFAATTHHNAKSLAHAKASQSYAMAPNTQDTYSPALTGGGSEGYNESEAQSVLTR